MAYRHYADLAVVGHQVTVVHVTPTTIQALSVLSVSWKLVVDVAAMRMMAPSTMLAVATSVTTTLTVQSLSMMTDPWHVSDSSKR
jgi:hypothetical protein